jgi:hypothetical protein
MSDERTRTIAEIERDLEATQKRLADSVASLIERTHPRSVAERTLETARTALTDRLAELRAKFIGPDGSIDLRRVAMAGGAVAGAFVFLRLLRKVFRRR